MNGVTKVFRFPNKVKESYLKVLEDKWIWGVITTNCTSICTAISIFNNFSHLETLFVSFIGHVATLRLLLRLKLWQIELCNSWVIDINLYSNASSCHAFMAYNTLGLKLLMDKQNWTQIGPPPIPKAFSLCHFEFQNQILDVKTVKGQSGDSLLIHMNTSPFK